LAKNVGCRAIGVDINEGMIERSRERAQREGVTDKVEFKVADAQELPFGNDLFDAVISESVTVFPEDKQQAVGEYVRVTKPGGYVGLNESVWLKGSPPLEITAWVFQDVGGNVQPLTAEGWAQLLESAGLKDIIARSSEINTRQEAKGLLRRYGLGEALCIMGRMLWLYIRSPEYRSFVKGVRARGVIPANLAEYLGYGLFVGRK
jgi:ubiquinone/menaquinone biosynthesis C-methylase UbiE